MDLTNKGQDRSYYYNGGESYEIARFQTNSITTPVDVNGFTLTNS
jgi:hypothetical protein